MEVGVTSDASLGTFEWGTWLILVSRYVHVEIRMANQLEELLSEME